MKIFEPQAPNAPEPVFCLNGMPYYPHRSEPVWVQPGAFVKTYNSMTKLLEYKEDETKRLSASELIARHATLEEMMLWPREWTNGWQKWLVAEYNAFKARI